MAGTIVTNVGDETEAVKETSTTEKIEKEKVENAEKAEKVDNEVEKTDEQKIAEEKLEGEMKKLFDEEEEEEEEEEMVKIPSSLNISQVEPKLQGASGSKPFKVLITLFGFANLSHRILLITTYIR